MVYTRFPVKIGLAIMLLGLASVLAGCGFSAGGATEMEISGADNGRQFEVRVDQVLVITLKSNPSTGYHWDVVSGTGGVLVQKGDVDFILDSELDPPPPGAGGVEVYRFEAVELGETQLVLIHHRPWEDEAPLETFAIQVVVR